jgi:hypothetical protein
MSQDSNSSITLIKDQYDSDTKVKRQVSRTRIEYSVLFHNIIKDCDSNNEVYFPAQYNDVFEDYILYLDCCHIELSSIKRCLELCHYLEDNNYFCLLVKQLFIIWSRDITLFKYATSLSIDINDLNYIDLQSDIYIQSPYQFLPDYYVADNKMFDKWLTANENKIFYIQDKDYYHGNGNSNEYCRVYYHKIFRQKDKKTIVVPYLMHGSNIRSSYKHGKEREWYESGRLKEVRPYHYDKKVDVHIGYHDNDDNHMMFQDYYFDGSLQRSKIWRLSDDKQVDGYTPVEMAFKYGKTKSN